MLHLTIRPNNYVKGTHIIGLGPGNELMIYFWTKNDKPINFHGNSVGIMDL